MQTHPRSRRRRRRRQRIVVVVIVIVLVVIIAGVAFITRRYSSSDEPADFAEFYGLTSENEAMINYDHTVLDEKARYVDGEVYLPYDWFHSALNARFYWDSAAQILRYVLPDGIVQAGVDTAAYTIASEEYTWDAPIVQVDDGQMYLSLSFLAQYTDIRYAIYEEPHRVVLSDVWDEETVIAMKRDTEVRELGGNKSPVLTSVSKEDTVTVLEAMDDWTKVCTSDGFVGYVKNNTLGKEETQIATSVFEAPVYTHLQKEGEIVMAWHQTTNQSANDLLSSVLESTSGINVISPTWFYLNDNAGGIVSLANSAYVSECHRRGIEVWGLISNFENADVDTTAVLNSTTTRDALIANLMNEAVKYDLDGINVDFESLAGEAGTGFLEFIRELSLECRANQMILSIDNYAPSDYTAFYNRQEQAVFADYVVLMAYDEHYNGSDEGSVSSIGFVEEAVANTLEEVPADQLILGLPFYTRLWQLSAPMDGDVISSEALGMTEAENRVNENDGTIAWLEEAGQYYGEYELDGDTYEVWLENAESLDLKLSVMQENHLAGCAFWKLGYETSDVWSTVAKYIQ